MKEIIVKGNDKAQRLDRFLTKAVPLLPQSLMQKFIRTKRIKVNGARAERGYRLLEGDRVQLFIGDEFFSDISCKYAHLLEVKPQLDIIYEDENILIIDKKPGVVCQPDFPGDKESLVTRVQAYLLKTKQWIAQEENSFVPALCNRIDRNTGGIVLAAKNALALKTLNEKIRQREVEKYYLCIVCGKPKPEAGEVGGDILKDALTNTVQVLDSARQGAKRAVTLYKTLETKGDASLVECQILTGRSHQIRAHMAHIGTPLLGDRKYGGRQVPGEYQALYAYKVKFAFKGEPGALEYLKGREFSVPEVEFAKKYIDFFI